MEQVFIRGVTHDKNIAKISFVRVPDQPGIAATLFEGIGKTSVNIHLIVQAQSHQGTNDITFVVNKDVIPQLESTLKDLVKEVGAEEFIIDENVATVSVVGEGVQREPGTAAAIFKTLAREKINIDLISTSNLMISCVVPSNKLDEAVRALHGTFFPEKASN